MALNCRRIVELAAMAAAFLSTRMSSLKWENILNDDRRVSCDDDEDHDHDDDCC